MHKHQRTLNKYQLDDALYDFLHLPFAITIAILFFLDPLVYVAYGTCKPDYRDGALYEMHKFLETYSQNYSECVLSHMMYDIILLSHLLWRMMESVLHTYVLPGS